MAVLLFGGQDDGFLFLRLPRHRYLPTDAHVVGTGNRWLTMLLLVSTYKLILITADVARRWS